MNISAAQNRFSNLCSLALAVFLAVGCATEGTHDQSGAASGAASTVGKTSTGFSGADVTNATAMVRPVSGQKIKGQVELAKTTNGIHVIGTFEGLQPNAQHGFHIHEFGDCSDPKLQTVGSHWNPTGHPHGSPGASDHHTGDLGNLVSDGKGRATYDRVIETKDGSASMSPFIGRAFVVHKKADDMKTQPAGDSGDRVACGTIGIAKEATK